MQSNTKQQSKLNFGRKESHLDKHDRAKVKREAAKSETSTSSISAKLDSSGSLSGKDNFEFFYGNKSPFSQHFLVEFTINGVKFNCAEQYMMYMKAVTFDDKEYEKRILASNDPKEQKRFGRKVRKFDADIWRRQSVKVVERANEAKFSQNLNLKKELIATHPRILVETSPRDRLWGIGLGKNNPKAWNTKTWRGKNLLGYTLTRVRDNLMKKEAKENVTDTETVVTSVIKQTTGGKEEKSIEKVSTGKTSGIVDLDESNKKSSHGGKNANDEKGSKRCHDEDEPVNSKKVKLA